MSKFFNFINKVADVADAYEILKIKSNTPPEMVTSADFQEITLQSSKLVKLFKSLKVKNLEDLHEKTRQEWNKYTIKALKENDKENIINAVDTAETLNWLGKFIDATPAIEYLEEALNIDITPLLKIKKEYNY